MEAQQASPGSPPPGSDFVNTLREHRRGIGISLLAGGFLPAPVAYLGILGAQTAPSTNPPMLVLGFYAIACLCGGLFALGAIRKWTTAVVFVAIGATGLAEVGLAFPPTQAPPPTVMTNFVPGIVYVPGQPVANRKVGRIVWLHRHSSGRCLIHSLRDPNQRYAFLCVTNDGVWLDPCFPIPRYQGGDVACPHTPWAVAETPQGSTYEAAYGIFRVKHINNKAGATGSGWKRPWALELQGHILCFLLGSRTSIPAASPTQLYDCGTSPPARTPELPGEVPVIRSGFVVSDFPNEQHGRWTVSYQPKGGQVATIGVVEAFK